MNHPLVIDRDITDGTSCTDETHIHGCPCRAGGDAVIAPFYCRCRANRFETRDQADASNAKRFTAPSGVNMPVKCGICHTFATDHEFYGDESSDFRCFEDDIRSGSHR